jgi:hypothetical protein
MANASTLVGTPVSTAVASDPDLCRISGYLKDLHGNPLPGVGLMFVNTYNPLGIATNTLLLQERTTVRSDKNGYVEFDLLRKACVTVNLPNLMTDVTMHLVVPDAASSDLVDFLFPYLVEVQFVDTSPLAVIIDEIATIEMKGILSNLVEVELESSVVVLLSSNEAVLRKNSGHIFQGLTAGSSAVSVESVDTAPLKLLLANDGTTPITLFEQPTVILPTDLTVNVT